MTKREFLEELKEVLSEQLPQNQVAEHVSYYMNYIEEQKQNESSEEEVLNMLGDPPSDCQNHSGYCTQQQRKSKLFL